MTLGIWLDRVVPIVSSNGYCVCCQNKKEKRKKGKKEKRGDTAASRLLVENRPLFHYGPQNLLMASTNSKFASAPFLGNISTVPSMRLRTAL